MHDCMVLYTKTYIFPEIKKGDMADVAEVLKWFPFWLKGHRYAIALRLAVSAHQQQWLETFVPIQVSGFS